MYPINRIEVSRSISRGEDLSAENPPRSQFEEQADDLIDEIYSLVNNERINLKESKIMAEKQLQSFEDYLNMEANSLASEKALWDRNIKASAKMFSPAQEIIELDIGGTHKITTTLSTLCKAEGSALAAMFNGKHKNKKIKERVFIDRDGDPFCYMITYLRNQRFPHFLKEEDENLFYEELEYRLLVF